MKAEYIERFFLLEINSDDRMQMLPTKLVENICITVCEMRAVGCILGAAELILLVRSEFMTNIHLTPLMQPCYTKLLQNASKMDNISSDIHVIDVVYIW